MDQFVRIYCTTPEKNFATEAQKNLSISLENDFAGVTLFVNSILLRYDENYEEFGLSVFNRPISDITALAGTVWPEHIPRGGRSLCDGRAGKPAPIA